MYVYLRIFISIMVYFTIIFLPIETTSDQSGLPTQPPPILEDTYFLEVVPVYNIEIADDLEVKDQRLVYKVEQQVWYYGKGDNRQVALTFDDGPDNYFTYQILDILQEYDIKATFFVIGSNVERFPEVIRRIAHDGHVIGNHSWSHKDFTKISPNSMGAEIVKTDEALNSIIGKKHTNIFRPPYGSYNKEVLETVHSLNYNCIYWSVDTKDWANTPITSMIKTVSSQITPGGIILMHCSGSNGAMRNVVKALPEIIETIKDLGYEFGTIPDVLEFNQQVNHQNLREL